jgi:RNA polymerase sigma-70 factor (ECF subfamily)
LLRLGSAMAAPPLTNWTNWSDAALAEQISERGALASHCEAEVARRFSPRIKLYGLRHLRNVSAAEDLTQRVLMLTLEKLRARQVREPEKLGSFVLGAARTLTQASRRRSQREVLDAEGLHREAEAAPSALPDPALRARLEGCLGVLPERERSVVLMSFLEDDDAQSIGQTLGMDANHVRVTRHRALAKLRACLGEARLDEVLP